MDLWMLALYGGPLSVLVVMALVILWTVRSRGSNAKLLKIEPPEPEIDSALDSSHIGFAPLVGRTDLRAPRMANMATGGSAARDR